VKGNAPGWILECRKCGKWGRAEDVGIVRRGATSKGKRVLGRCSGCGRLRWLALVKDQERYDSLHESD